LNKNAGKNRGEGVGRARNWRELKREDSSQGLKD